MKNNVNSEKVSPKIASEMLGVSINLLAVWRHRGCHLDFLKIGKSIKYDVAVLNRFKESWNKYVTTNH